MKNKGFTLLEVVIVILSLGILGSVAIPKIMTLRAEAKLAAEKQAIASTRVGINVYYVKSTINRRIPLYPAILDSASATYASATNAFFINVLAAPGVIDGEWRKLSSVLYQSPAGNFYVYDPLTGDFNGTQIIDDAILAALGMARKDITMDFINQMSSKNLITLANGKKLVGGCAVIVPQSSGEPKLVGTDTGIEKFSSFAGTLNAEITGEYAGWAAQITFGYYTINPATGQKVLHQLFKGADTTGAKSSFPTNSGDTVGFYMTTPQGSGYTYYSETNSNSDKADHMKLYMNTSLRKITIGCEDTNAGGDKDYQDFIVTLSY
jgi:prepilin-type N-terminal cleavage/methylation domain-containing protein